MSEQLQVDLTDDDIAELLTIFVNKNFSPESQEVFTEATQNKPNTSMVLQKAIYDATINEAANRLIEVWLND